MTKKIPPCTRPGRLNHTPAKPGKERDMNTYNVRIGLDGATHKVSGITVMEAVKTLTINEGTHTVWVATERGWVLVGTVTLRTAHV